jgi:DNA-binding FrmR family transcriptional regulator
MPNPTAIRRRVVTRRRRIRGQAEAMEVSVEAGTDCGELLHQLAAHRLMADVLESHLRESFGPGADHAVAAADPQTRLDHLVVLVRSFTR